MAAEVAGRALDPDQRAAVFHRPGHPVRGERVGPEPLVPVDGRRREYRHRRRVLEQPGHVLPPDVRQRRGRGGERVRPAQPVHQGLVQVPSGRKEVRQPRPAHEGRQQPAPLAHLLDRRAEQHRRIGRRQPGQRAEAELQLPGSPLVLHRPRQQPHPVQRVADRLKHRAHPVQPHLGQVLVTPLEHGDRRRRGSEPRVLRQQRPAGQGHDVELDLDPGQEVVPRVTQRGQHPPEQPAPVQRHRLPVTEVHVAQHPAGAVGPGQDAEGGRVRHQHHVREPGELLEAEAPALGERGHEHLVAGVQAVDRAGEVEPVGHGRDRRLRRQHLAPRHAVLVDHDEPDGPKLRGTDRVRHLPGEGFPLRRGQAVPAHEARLPDTRRIDGNRGRSQ